jgi:hypothetical protein
VTLAQRSGARVEPTVEADVTTNRGKLTPLGQAAAAAPVDDLPATSAGSGLPARPAIRSKPSSRNSTRKH